MTHSCLRLLRVLLHRCCRQIHALLLTLICHQAHPERRIMARTIRALDKADVTDERHVLQRQRQPKGLGAAAIKVHVHRVMHGPQLGRPVRAGFPARTSLLLLLPTLYTWRAYLVCCLRCAVLRSQRPIERDQISLQTLVQDLPARPGSPALLSLLRASPTGSPSRVGALKLEDLCRLGTWQRDWLQKRGLRPLMRSLALIIPKRFPFGAHSTTSSRRMLTQCSILMARAIFMAHDGISYASPRIHARSFRYMCAALGALRIRTTGHA